MDCRPKPKGYLLYSHYQRYNVNNASIVDFQSIIATTLSREKPPLPMTPQPLQRTVLRASRMEWTFSISRRRTTQSRLIVKIYTALLYKSTVFCRKRENSSSPLIYSRRKNGPESCAFRAA